MEKEIDFDRVEYATNREVENDEGETTGYIKMFSYDTETYFYELVCPHCEHKFEGEQELGSRPWWIECPECGRSTNVYRIKDKEEKKVKKRGPDTPDDMPE